MRRLSQHANESGFSYVYLMVKEGEGIRAQISGATPEELEQKEWDEFYKLYEASDKVRAGFQFINKVTREKNLASILRQSQELLSRSSKKATHLNQVSGEIVVYAKEELESATASSLAMKYVDGLAQRSIRSMEGVVGGFTMANEKRFQSEDSIASLAKQST